MTTTERPTFTAFYSWQSDLPARTNRTLIEDALTKAAKALRADEALHVEPVIDRDTVGKAGAPNIAATIFDKIDAANAFVADVSFITPPTPDDATRRPCPNPNVLLELGFALHRHGWEHIVLVFNEHFGAVQDLPFDLRGHRVLAYRSAPDDGDRAVPRRALQQAFEEALRLMAMAPAPPIETVVARAVRAISAAHQGRRGDLRAALADINVRLAAVAPDLAKGTLDTAAFISGLDAATGAIADYDALAQAAALHDDRDAVIELVAALEPVAAGYHLPRAFSGQFWNHQFEFWQQVGYELVLGLVALLLRERRLDALGDVLRTRLHVPNGPSGGADQVLLGYLNPRTTYHQDAWGKQQLGTRGRYVSSIGELLKTRTAKSPLAGVVSFAELQAADMFFALWSAALPDPPVGRLKSDWIAHAAVLMRDPPRFLTDAYRTAVARQLAQTLGFASPEALRGFVVDGLAKQLREPFPGHYHLAGFEFPNAHRIGAEA